MLHFSRDPFARQDRIRVSANKTYRGDFTCDWCGSKRKVLYHYGVSPDSIGARDYIDYSHKFCNRNCADSFSG